MLAKRILSVSILLTCHIGVSPARDRFWTQTNGPTGGRITNLTIDPLGRLYCGTQSGNIFRYSRNEQLWKPILLGATRNDIVSMVTDSTAKIYFATRNEGVFRVHRDNAWEKISRGIEKLEITDLAVLPNGILFAGTSTGLYRSMNHGRTWINASPLIKRVDIIHVDRNVSYVGSGDGVLFISTDGGLHWSVLSALEADAFRSLAVGTDRRVYAGTENGFVFQYSGINRKWEKLAHFENNSVSALTVDSTNNVYVGLSGPAFSNIGGGIYLIAPGQGQPRFLFKDRSNAVWRISIAGNVVYAGTNAGIYYSNNSDDNWLPFNSGLIAQRVNDIVIGEKDVLFVGSYGGVFRSVDHGDTWIETNSGLDEIGILDMAINESGHLFVGTYTGTIYRSVDSGNSWLKKSTGIPGKHWIMSLALNSTDQIFAAVSRAGIYRSSNNGDSWEPVNFGLEDGNYNALVINSDDVIFSSNEKGNVFRSDDNGETWQRLQAKNPIGDSAAELAVDVEKRLYFGSVDKGVFRYSEIDQTWVPLHRGLTNNSIRSLIVTKEGLIFAGTSGTTNYRDFHGQDMYVTSIKGSHWTLMNEGLGHPRIKALAVNSKGVLFAGTWGGGVYKRQLSVPR